MPDNDNSQSPGEAALRYTPFKWTGCKRKQADRIISLMPDIVEKYAEPFLGSGAVALRLMASGKAVPGRTRITCSDTNPDLIRLWELIRDNPGKVSEFYAGVFRAFNTPDGAKGPDTSAVDARDRASSPIVARRNKVYYALRDDYNEARLDGSDKSAVMLFALLKLDFNGLVRYGPSGFNAPCQPLRCGMAPETSAGILAATSRLLRSFGAEFRRSGYDGLPAGAYSGAVVYCDPPYAMFLNKAKADPGGRKAPGRGVYGSDDFDLDAFGEWCRGLDCAELLVSFDGGDVGRRWFPEDLYDKREHDMGWSAFALAGNHKRHQKNIESLYVRKR